MKENCNVCKHKRKKYIRVYDYGAKFGCSAKKENYMRAIPGYKCRFYEVKQPEAK